MAAGDSTPPLTTADRIAILAAVVLPTAVTWLYFIALDGADARLQKTAYAVGKTVQFALPAVWVWLVQRQRPRWAAPPRWSLIIGLLFGLAVAAAMAGLYFGVLKPAGLFDQPAAVIRAKVESFGATSPLLYLLLALFYSAIHSLLEEYYWRWFVFGQLARSCQPATAISLSAVAFSLHHVLVLAHYFAWSSPLTWLFTLGVIVGGAFWAWLYQRSNSLAAPWLSHALVDAAIFGIGYQLITSGTTFGK